MRGTLDTSRSTVHLVTVDNQRLTDQLSELSKLKMTASMTTSSKKWSDRHRRHRHDSDSDDHHDEPSLMVDAATEPWAGVGALGDHHQATDASMSSMSATTISMSEVEELRAHLAHLQDALEAEKEKQRSAVNEHLIADSSPTTTATKETGTQSESSPPSPSPLSKVETAEMGVGTTEVTSSTCQEESKVEKSNEVGSKNVPSARPTSCSARETLSLAPSTTMTTTTKMTPPPPPPPPLPPTTKIRMPESASKAYAAAPAATTPKVPAVAVHVPKRSDKVEDKDDIRPALAATKVLKASREVVPAETANATTTPTTTTTVQPPEEVKVSPFAAWKKMEQESLLSSRQLPIPIQARPVPRRTFPVHAHAAVVNISNAVNVPTVNAPTVNAPAARDASTFPYQQQRERAVRGSGSGVPAPAGAPPSPVSSPVKAFASSRTTATATTKSTTTTHSPSPASPSTTNTSPTTSTFVMPALRKVPKPPPKSPPRVQVEREQVVVVVPPPPSPSWRSNNSSAASVSITNATIATATKSTTTNTIATHSIAVNTSVATSTMATNTIAVNTTVATNTIATTTATTTKSSSTSTIAVATDTVATGTTSVPTTDVQVQVWPDTMDQSVLTHMEQQPLVVVAAPPLPPPLPSTKPRNAAVQVDHRPTEHRSVETETSPVRPVHRPVHRPVRPMQQDRATQTEKEMVQPAPAPPPAAAVSRVAATKDRAVETLSLSVMSRGCMTASPGVVTTQRQQDRAVDATPPVMTRGCMTIPPSVPLLTHAVLGMWLLKTRADGADKRRYVWLNPWMRQLLWSRRPPGSTSASSLSLSSASSASSVPVKCGMSGSQEAVAVVWILTHLYLTHYSPPCAHPFPLTSTYLPAPYHDTPPHPTPFYHPPVTIREYRHYPSLHLLEIIPTDVPALYFRFTSQRDLRIWTESLEFVVRRRALPTLLC